MPVESDKIHYVKFKNRDAPHSRNHWHSLLGPGKPSFLRSWAPTLQFLDEDVRTRGFQTEPPYLIGVNEFRWGIPRVFT